MYYKKMIIGITGKKGSGKSTIAQYLYLVHGFIAIPMAEKLKDLIQDLFDLNSAQVYHEQKDEIDERWGVTPRPQRGALPLY